MFGLPNAKRVRRDELDEEPPVSSFEGGEEARAQLREALSAKLAGSLHWDLVPTQPLEPPSQKPSGDANPATGGGGEMGNGDDDAETDEEEPPEEFAFRLFGSSNPAAKVTLEKDRPFKPGQGGILARRPPAYYLARPSQRLREEYASVLVTWEQITEKSRQRFWGLERPWRTIAGIAAASEGRPESGRKGASEAAAEGREQESRGRKRLGKKTRIVRRKRERAAAAEREAAEKIRGEKEEHLKAKKKRLNQVKKVRARAKAKAQKAAARSAGDGGGDGGEDGQGADEALPAAGGTAADTTTDVSMGGT